MTLTILANSRILMKPCFVNGFTSTRISAQLLVCRLDIQYMVICPYPNPCFIPGFERTVLFIDSDTLSSQTPDMNSWSLFSSMDFATTKSTFNLVPRQPHQVAEFKVRKNDHTDIQNKSPRLFSPFGIDCLKRNVYQFQASLSTHWNLKMYRGPMRFVTCQTCIQILRGHRANFGKDFAIVLVTLHRI